MNTNISELEDELKYNFVNFLQMFPILFKYLQAKKTRRKKNEVIKCCGEIVQFFKRFEKIFEAFKIPKKYLDSDKFLFTIEDFNNYFLNDGLFEQNKWIHIFLEVFQNEQKHKSKDIFYYIKKLSKISESKCNYDNIHKIASKIWFKLHISVFFRSYIKTYNWHNEEKIPIPAIRQFCNIS